jgi:hypothetical protein
MIFSLGSSLMFCIVICQNVLQMSTFCGLERQMSLAEYRCVSPWLLPALLPKDHGARARVTAAYCVNRLLRQDGADERTRTAFLLITSVRSMVAELCTGLQIPHR